MYGKNSAKNNSCLHVEKKKGEIANTKGLTSQNRVDFHNSAVNLDIFMVDKFKKYSKVAFPPYIHPRKSTECYNQYGVQRVIY